MWKAIYLERFVPCRFGADFFGVRLDWNDLLLEEEQHTVHDSQDEMRRLAELSQCCDVRRFDGLKKTANNVYDVTTNHADDLSQYLTCSAASASSSAGLAALSFSSANAFSTAIESTIACARSFTTCTDAFTFSAAAELAATTFLVGDSKFLFFHDELLGELINTGRGFDDLGETRVHALGHISNVRLLFLVDSFVAVDKRQVRLRRHVRLASEAEATDNHVHFWDSLQELR